MIFSNSCHSKHKRVTNIDEVQTFGMYFQSTHNSINITLNQIRNNKLG